MEWVKAAEAAAVKDGAVTPVFPKGLQVLVYRAGGGLKAWENRCAHLGCPLTRGRLDGAVLTCPCHDWRYDLATGEFLDAPAIKLKAYPCELRPDGLYIGI